MSSEEFGDDLLDLTIDDADSASGSAASPAASAREESLDAQAVAVLSALSVSKQGYLLKRCRHRGEQKPWKRRFFTLRGSSLLYYPTKDAAATLRPKLFAQLTPQASVAVDAEPQQHSHVLRIVCGPEALYLSAASPAEMESWLGALRGSCGAPAVDMGSAAGAAVAGMTLATRVKMSMASAVATSTLGQAMLTRYLDPAARELLRHLVRLAAALADERRAAVLKSYLLDVAARLVVIAHEGRIPSDTNLDALQEDTLSFTQDFLMYSRDQRLKEQRGPEAEVVPIDLPSLITPFTRVAAVWRTILEGSCKPVVLTRFDELFAFFVDPKLITELLLSPRLRPQLAAIDEALRRLLEVF